MPRYMKINKGTECQVKTKGGVLTMRRCRKLNSKKEVSSLEVLKGLGIRSY